MKKTRFKIYKIFISVIAIILFIGIVFFIINIPKFTYKKRNNGNNITNKSLDECERYILDINSYDALLEVTVNSNKNTNIYEIKQEVNKEQTVQEIKKPENIKGLEFIYKDNRLTIKNTNLDLKKIYDNYESISNNYMFLTDFLKEYKENKKNNENKSRIKEEQGDVILKIEGRKSNEKIKTLYIDRNSGKPKQLIVQDNNHKSIIYILYKEINILS